MPDAEHLRAYKQTLFHCLNYLDGTDLDVDEDAVPQERLQTLMPTDLLRWFNFKTFGSSRRTSKTRRENAMAVKAKDRAYTSR